MYNWKWCKINGQEITSLKIAGNIVWVKLQQTFLGAPAYYLNIPIGGEDDVLTAIDTLNGTINFNNLTPINDLNLTIISEEGFPVIFARKGATSVKISWEEPGFGTTKVELTKGVLKWDPETEEIIYDQYDVAPETSINNEQYELWTECIDWKSINSGLNITIEIE